MANKRRLISSALLLSLAVPTIAGYHATPASAAAFADPAFGRTWTRTDQLVATGAVKRSFYWGPTAGETKTERFVDAPDGSGQRKVQYFDKSRMEINDPKADQNSQFYVTNGLLTVELISGKMQVGKSQYETRYPANIPLASDNDDVNAPTYASFFLIANSPLGDHPAVDTTGKPVNQVVNKAGIATHDASKEKYGVKYAFYNAETKHNIASQIWEFLNASGPVLSTDGKTTSQGKLSDPWFYTTGYAISEPYWANVKIAGKQSDVLIQLFERRVVTYVPDLPEGFKVQMGNIGAHYYDWRYNNAGQSIFPNATVKPMSPAAGSPGSKESPIKMAFAPSGNSTQILASGKPLGDLLTQVTGLQFDVTVPTSYAAVIEAMGSNNVDIGWLAPLQYVLANQKYGANVMLSTVRLGSLTYPSVFITADPTVKTIADFKGKKFAFVDPASASGFLYPFAALKSAGYIKGSGADAAKEFFSDVVYAGSHPNVVTAVYTGQVAGGAVFGGPLNPSTGNPTDARLTIAAAHPDVYQKVRIVGETQLIPNDTVTARKGLPADIVKQIQGGLLQITTMPAGRTLLYNLYQIDDLAPVNDSFYDPLRQVAQDAGLTNLESLNPTPTPKP
ncbi:MAG: phosphate/phosphite/phosphonate ABC transporter substrate-binding protein [Chloroflexota bacterium]|nr:phosphate/phosphite/phosphonate ABC transporter substrate-binding protein [Chloroflexota bacterium]